jgi:UDP-N-acetylglucosamine 2-epimerase (non-hydrolysing)
VAQRVHLIAAARPYFMKVAPLWHALKGSKDFEPVLVHTGQHYDANMSGDFLVELGLPEPDVSLGIGSGSHAEQTGGVMIAYERLAMKDSPDWVVVVGDVNSTVACAMVATKLGIRCAHLEAGLRSRDRTMPEELNRLATDVLCDVLWTPSSDADENLWAEGIPADRITRVGNIMLDSFELVRRSIESANTPASLGHPGKRYGVVTLHRPSNVDNADELTRIVAALIEVQRRLPLAFPLHPRTKARLESSGLIHELAESGAILLEPQPYIGFMSLVLHSAAVITDSGGIQEETTYLGIPCLTLRRNTERPITISEGTNRLVEPESLVLELEHALAAPPSSRKRPDLWDGRTAQRCVDDLRRRNNE